MTLHVTLNIFLALWLGFESPASPATQPDKIKVLVVTGGHGFKPAPFFKLFDDNPQVAYTTCAEDKSAEAYDRADLLSFDVIVLYDFQRELSDAQKAKFLALFDKGVGVIVLHHALLSYQNWPEYERIAGGKYLLDNEKDAVGNVTPASTYKGDVDIAVSVVAKDHPITAGLQDFVVRDEIYRGVRTTADITPLLLTEGRPLAWTRTERNARVVGIIIGHGPAYADANFQQLLAQSLRWAARRS
jgi:type 1 glutamine amidotransferase